MARIYAGTSGFAYASWKPDFYPPRLPSKNFLEHYAGRLNAVEINYTFRRLPSASTLEAWVRQVPEGFRFAPKAHQRITHFGRLQGVEEFTELFFRSIDPLRTSRRLGPVLFQLPPNLKCDRERLASFLARLPRDVRCAFEFRHDSWLTADVYALLSSHNAALCLADSGKLEIPRVITADFAYWRLRKQEYPPEDRARIAQWCRELAAGGKDAYVFFKHEDTPEGALYAEELLAARPADPSTNGQEIVNQKRP
jgi:uncharacterized protein YecE (DUF72 family)